MPQHLRLRVVDNIVDKNAPPNLWVDIKLDEQWQASYRLVDQDGLLVIGEIRVLPREGSNREVWTLAERIGLDAAAPAGGLRSTLLRRVAIPAVGQFARKHSEVMKRGATGRGRQQGRGDDSRGSCRTCDATTPGSSTTVSRVASRSERAGRCLLRWDREDLRRRIPEGHDPRNTQGGAEAASTRLGRACTQGGSSRASAGIHR